MEDTVVNISAAGVVQAILEGGPETIPVTSRMQVVDPFDEKVKLPHWGGYEHFERVGWSDESTSAEQLIFRWVMRTEMAE